MILLTDIILFGFLALLLLLWWNAQGARQIALSATKRYCQNSELQLLDETVALSKFRIKRDERGNVRLWRCYQFEFTATGFERYNGSVVMFGSQVGDIQLEPHRVN